MSPKTFIFSGISGSGKGTQINLLKKYIKEKFPESNEYSFVMGDTLRSFIKGEGYAVERVNEIMHSGKLVPDAVSSGLFITSLLHELHHDDVLYIDGIPRSVLQSDIIMSMLKFYNRSDVFIINLEINREEAERRMLLRQRPDDTKDSIASRLKFYDEEVVPAIEYLKEKSGFKYICIDGERSIEEIHNDIVSKI